MNESENVCTEAILVYSGYHSVIRLEGPMEVSENFSQDSRCPGEIQTEHLTNTGPESYRYLSK
jgi:hypothetical protein